MVKLEYFHAVIKKCLSTFLPLIVIAGFDRYNLIVNIILQLSDDLIMRQKIDPAERLF
jgi:hypothetical protein